MNQEDFNLFTASFSIIRAKKGLISQMNTNITNFKTLIGSFAGVQKSGPIKLRIKELESKIKELNKEIANMEESIPKFEKVYNKIEKKYFP